MKNAEESYTMKNTTKKFFLLRIYLWIKWQKLIRSLKGQFALFQKENSKNSYYENI